MLPKGLKISFSKFDKAYEKSKEGPPLVKSGDCKSLFSHTDTSSNIFFNPNP